MLRRRGGERTEKKIRKRDIIKEGLEKKQA
jgi:hypothetical protein